MSKTIREDIQSCAHTHPLFFFIGRNWTSSSESLCS